MGGLADAQGVLAASSHRGRFAALISFLNISFPTYVVRQLNVSRLGAPDEYLYSPTALLEDQLVAP